MSFTGFYTKDEPFNPPFTPRVKRSIVWWFQLFSLWFHFFGLNIQMKAILFSTVIYYYLPFCILQIEINLEFLSNFYLHSFGDKRATYPFKKTKANSTMLH